MPLPFEVERLFQMRQEFKSIARIEPKKTDSQPETTSESDGSQPCDQLAKIAELIHKFRD